MTILVLTRPNDGTTAGVVKELKHRGITGVRCDLGDFPLDMTMAASLAGSQEWSGTLTIAGRLVHLNEIRGIYYRRPTGFRLPAHLNRSKSGSRKRKPAGDSGACCSAYR